MRTIHVAFSTDVPEGSVTVSTEVIIADDADANAAGRDARAAMEAFTAGYAEDPR